MKPKKILSVQKLHKSWLTNTYKLVMILQIKNLLNVFKIDYLLFKDKNGMFTHPQAIQDFNFTQWTTVYLHIKIMVA